MSTKSKSNYDRLASVKTADRVEKKGGRSYLSWAWSWHLLKSEFPDANRTVYEDPDTGLNYFTDDNTGYVKVGITVDGLEHIDYLPVMDHRFKAIPKGNITQFDVNKTIQRSTAKAIAMHGLGLSLWMGEDTALMGDNGSGEAPSDGGASQKSSKDVASKPTDKITLEVDSENWHKVMKYVTANKDLGLRAIAKNLTQKYKLTVPVKREIKKHFEALQDDA
jgi:hypothetical protein